MEFHVKKQHILGQAPCFNFGISLMWNRYVEIRIIFQNSFCLYTFLKFITKMSNLDCFQHNSVMQKVNFGGTSNLFKWLTRNFTVWSAKYLVILKTIRLMIYRYFYKTTFFFFHRFTCSISKNRSWDLSASSI